jgi:hypothetical protein
MILASLGIEFNWTKTARQLGSQQPTKTSFYDVWLTFVALIKDTMQLPQEECYFDSSEKDLDRFLKVMKRNL